MLGARTSGPVAQEPIQMHRIDQLFLLVTLSLHFKNHFLLHLEKHLDDTPTLLLKDTQPSVWRVLAKVKKQQEGSAAACTSARDSTSCSHS